eukprot:COSAG01_NODE_14821_length_1406_cov_1.731446_3_plen_81_part_00
MKRLRRHDSSARVAGRGGGGGGGGGGAQGRKVAVDVGPGKIMVKSVISAQLFLASIVVDEAMCAVTGAGSTKLRLPNFYK